MQDGERDTVCDFLLELLEPIPRVFFTVCIVPGQFIFVCFCLSPYAAQKSAIEW